MYIIYGTKNGKSTNNILYLNENDLSIPFGKDGYKKPISIINDIEKQIVLGKKIPELLKYSDVSLWWYIYPSIFPAIKKTINFIEKFNDLIIDKNPNKIKLVGEFDKLSLIKQICKQKKIKLDYSKSMHLKFLMYRWLVKKTQKYRFRKITLEKSRKRIQIFKNKNQTIPILHDKVIFAISTFYRRFVFRPKVGLVRGEYIQGPIIDMVKNLGFEVVGLDMDYTFKGLHGVLEERLDDDIPWFLVEMVLEKYCNNIDLSVVLKQYERTINNGEFKKLFNFGGIEYWEQVENEFLKQTFLPHLPTYIKLIIGFERFFKENKPHAVFIPYETGPLALPIITACKKNNIRTISIQHGMTYPYNPDYSHNDIRSEKNPMGMILPDFNLIFGDYVKKLLCEKGNYPKDKFIVFGNPEFFNLKELIKSLDHIDILSTYGLPNKKIILFTSTKMQSYYKSYGKMNYDEQIWRHLLENFANKNNFYLVLKPHPSENISAYEKILNELQVSNAKIIQGELFEMIYTASVVISIASTTILDAICLRKPVIRVKFKNVTSPIPYDEYGVVLSSELDVLSKNIESLVNKKDIQDDLLKNGFQFIKEQYNIPEEDPQSILEYILK